MFLKIKRNILHFLKYKPLNLSIETPLKINKSFQSISPITLYYVNVGLPFVRLVAWDTKSIFSRGVSRIRERNDDRRGEGSKLFVNYGR